MTIEFQEGEEDVIVSKIGSESGLSSTEDSDVNKTLL